VRAFFAFKWIEKWIYNMRTFYSRPKLGIRTNSTLLNILTFLYYYIEKVS